LNKTGGPLLKKGRLALPSFFGETLPTMKTLLTSLTIALLALVNATAYGAAGWTDNYEKALAEAKSQNKKVLLDFTGSDWCSWCMRLNKEVFSTPKFKEYAKQNLILVEADFPQTKKLPKKVQEQNEKLQAEFKVQGYPTVFILDGDGKQLKQLGYMEGGPDAFIAKIEEGTKH
jgi:thioredoxin-related protein